MFRDGNALISIKEVAPCRLVLAWVTVCG